jgi:hypothetical protein
MLESVGALTLICRWPNLLRINVRMSLTNALSEMSRYNTYNSLDKNPCAWVKTTRSVSMILPCALGRSQATDDLAAN